MVQVAGGGGSTRSSTPTRTPTPYRGGPSPRAMDNTPAAPPGVSFTSQNATDWIAAGSRPTTPSYAGSLSSGGGGGGGGYGGGGGGGGGPAPVDMTSMYALMNRKPQEYSYNRLWFDPYEGQGFYDFNGGQYDRMRQGVSEGVAADKAAGAAAYGDARGELGRYRNAYANNGQTMNPQTSEAMQRMLAANGVGVDQVEADRGAQADSAFGNVMALLAGNAQNRQDAEMRALGGDERRFGESMNSQARSMNFGVDMREAQAREQYEKDKWQYGEQVARQNYEARQQNRQYNHQNRSTIDQANVGMANEFNSTNIQRLLELIASGQAADPAQLQQYTAGG